jgi:Carbohydrate-binding family 9
VKQLRATRPGEALAWSEAFVDMATGSPAVLQTVCAIANEADALVVQFKCEEPYPTAKVFERDGIVFQDNDVEVFIDFGWGYYEFELNAAGTIYEVMHVWRDSFSESPFVHDPDWVITNPNVYTFAGDFDRRPASFWEGTHPRGVRIAHRAYDLPGLQTTVTIDGELNNPHLRSNGWEATVRFPWDALATLSQGRFHHVMQGHITMFLGRFQQLQISGQNVAAAWCVSPHGVADTHQPEQFTQVLINRS